MVKSDSMFKLIKALVVIGGASIGVYTGWPSGLSIALGALFGAFIGSMVISLIEW